MPNNSERYDLSKHLIHFFRNLDLDDDSSPDTPEDWGIGNIAEDVVFSSMFLMRSAIRHGHLWATWSRRNGRRTIYGPNPAICYTEMPTAAFIEASIARQQAGQKISTHALTFQKNEVFALGANPVIYGLNDRSAAIPSGRDGGPRLIDSALLPLKEQYRYVTYNPNANKAIDWTHEREWRWPYTNDINAYQRMLEEVGVANGVKEIPGLDLYSGELSGIGVIVNSNEESQMVLHDILSLIDRRIISPQTYSYILVTDSIGTVSSLRDPEQESLALAAAMIDLTLFITPVPAKDKQIAERVMQLIYEIECGAGVPENGEPGGCWLWMLDNFHEVTRALLNEGRLVVNDHGQYLVQLFEYDDSRSLRQREKMTQELAKRISVEFGVSAGYFSVLGSSDYNGYPFYSSIHQNNCIYYNQNTYGL